jgi:predicted ATPase
MSKIRVENFGPIRAGFGGSDGFMDIRKVTIFIGNQGTGKSSVAKLISILSWLEKALYRQEIEEKYVISYSRFINVYCGYQNLKDYFSPETKIEYQGAAYNISFSDSKLSVSAITKADGYIVPKIMYVPAERNFLSLVKQPNKLKGLPQALYTFLEELERSQQELSSSLELPVGGVEFEFDKLNKVSNIVGSDYKIKLSEASSGFQSFVPLFLVSRNLALSINKKEKDNSKNELSSDEQKKLKSEIQKILSNEKLSEEFKQTALELLSSKYRNGCFINIVEEIEQNLFPESQRDVFYKLIEFANDTVGNQLIMTTHSPYIINYLTLAIKGHSVLLKISSLPDNEMLTQQLKEIVPNQSCISAENTIVYELNNEGGINLLSTYAGLPSDENYLNNSLVEANQSFCKLLEIENSL